jgi:hypothetical protein
VLGLRLGLGLGLPGYPSLTGCNRVRCSGLGSGWVVLCSALALFSSFNLFFIKPTFSIFWIFCCQSQARALANAITPHNYLC